MQAYRPTCPLKASMMKCNAWGWTHSIHFCTTWLPFWSFTHFNTWPSSSLTISLWKTGDKAGAFSNCYRFHNGSRPNKQEPSLNSCPEEIWLESIKGRWIPFFQRLSHFTLPPKTTSCGCSARISSWLPAVQHLHVNSGTISFVQGWR